MCNTSHCYLLVDLYYSHFQTFYKVWNGGGGGRLEFSLLDTSSFMEIWKLIFWFGFLASTKGVVVKVDHPYMLFVDSAQFKFTRLTTYH